MGALERGSSPFADPDVGTASLSGLAVSLDPPGHLVHGRGEEKETIPGAFGAASFFLLAVDQVP
jgi:hypothetical protein